MGIAKECGHEFIPDDLKKIEVSARELENIAGGIYGNSLFGDCNQTNEEGHCIECKL